MILFQTFESNPRVQDIFPAFKNLKLEAVINSRSLYLHVRRVMTALKMCVFFKRRGGFHRVFNEPGRKTQSMAREAGAFRCMNSITPIKAHLGVHFVV